MYVQYIEKVKYSRSKTSDVQLTPRTCDRLNENSAVRFYLNELQPGGDKRPQNSSTSTSASTSRNYIVETTGTANRTATATPMMMTTENTLSSSSSSSLPLPVK